jgi:hypothetical protein
VREPGITARGGFGLLVACLVAVVAALILLAPVASTTIAWIGFSHDSNGTGRPGSSQLTLNAPAVTTGDVLVAQVVVAGSFGESDTICAPADWERILRTDVAEGTIVIESFYRIVTQASASASHTWQFKTVSSACGAAGSERADTGASGGMIRYKGVDTTHPLDVPALGAAGSGATALAPALRTATERTRIVRFFGASKAPGSGVDFRGGRIYQEGSASNGAERTAVAYDGPLTTVGSTNVFVGLGTTAEWGGQSIALRMATAPTTISNVSGNGSHDGTATLTATLTSGSTGVTGKTVTFTVDDEVVGTAATDANGVATLPNVELTGLEAGQAGEVGASFDGDVALGASEGHGGLLFRAPRGGAGSIMNVA